MAQNSADEDPNDVGNSSLEFNSEDDNFDDFLDDELNPKPMTDDRFLDHRYDNNVPNLSQQITNVSNLNRNGNNSNSRFQKPYISENLNDSAYIEPIPGKNEINLLNHVQPETPVNRSTLNNPTGNVNLSKTSGSSLKILNRGLINKNSQNLDSNTNPINTLPNSNNTIDNSSINYTNKSEISFPPLSMQSGQNLKTQQKPTITSRVLGSRLLQNSNDSKGTSDPVQSIPGIPVVESGSGNFNLSLQSSLFTKNDDGSTIINFPPLNGESDKKATRIAQSSIINTNPTQVQNKIINFPPLKGEESVNQQQISKTQNEQLKEAQNTLQLPSISVLDQSQVQQPSQIRVSIKPKFLLKQASQSATKPQVSFNVNHQKQENSLITPNQENQTVNTLNQDQIPNTNQFPQTQNQMQNFQQNHLQNSPQLQLNLQQQELTNNNQQISSNMQPFSISTSQNSISSSQPYQSRIQNNYVLTPTDRVAISFENKLDLSLSALRRSIASELNSSLRLSYRTNQEAGTSSDHNQDSNRPTILSERYSFTGRLPSSFDSDVDSFLDNLNSELVNAVSFAPLIGVSESSFSTSIYGNNLFNNNNLISSVASTNNTEVMNVSTNINNQYNINNAANVDQLNRNSFLNMSINMSFAAERYVSILSQNIGNVIDENLRPITSGLAASSIVDKQLCNEQMKSLKKLKNEISSLRSLFKSGASQIFEKLNQKMSLFESNEQEDTKRRRTFNKSLNELRYRKKDLEMQLQRYAEEKAKNDAAIRSLNEKRKKVYMENCTKSGTDMKLNKLLKIIENIEKEIKSDNNVFNSSSSNRSMNFSVAPNSLNYINSIDSSKMFGDFLSSLDNAEKIINMDEESMRMHIMELNTSNRWINNNISAMSRLMAMENISNSSIGSRSQLQLQYSPNRKKPSSIMSPRRENRHISFV